MKIGVGLDSRLQLSFSELRGLGKDAAAMGFESMWTPIMTVPDAFHVCAAWNEASSEVVSGGLGTGIGVIPAPQLWKPESLAAQAATVALRSGDKFILGIGTGGYGKDAWAKLGLANKPLTYMREYLEVLPRLFAGEPVEYNGQSFKMGEFSLGTKVNVPVYLAALGPQMLRLAGSHANGVSLNWATPEQIAESRTEVAAAAIAAGRSPEDVPLTMYIRVCVDDDIDKARRAFTAQVLSYAMARPGVDPSLGYRAHFGRMGFEDVLRKLEEKRNAGASVADLTDEVPDDLLLTVGYFGPAAGAAEHFARLSTGLDHTIVRIVSAQRGVAPVLAAMNALTPEKIRAATK